MFTFIVFRIPSAGRSDGEWIKYASFYFNFFLRSSTGHDGDLRRSAYRILRFITKSSESFRRTEIKENSWSTYKSHLKPAQLAGLQKLYVI